jgi:hypothetical protein
MLSQDGGETFNTASHGAVDHDGPRTTRRKGLLYEERLLLLLSILLLLGSSVSRWGWCRGRGRVLLVLLRALSSLILKREVDGLLEVKLNGGTLPLPLPKMLAVVWEHTCKGTLR